MVIVSGMFPFTCCELCDLPSCSLMLSDKDGRPNVEQPHEFERGLMLSEQQRRSCENIETSNQTIFRSMTISHILLTGLFAFYCQQDNSADIK